jgi:hypothetical protein
MRINYFYAQNTQTSTIHRFRFKIDREAYLKCTFPHSASIPASHPLVRWALRQSNLTWPVKYYE